jgi:hypothetical protein
MLVFRGTRSIKRRAFGWRRAPRIDSDLDGYWVGLAPGRIWFFHVHHFQCDGQSFASAGNYRLLSYRTPVLRAMDFEALPIDFRLRLSATEITTWHLGPNGWVNVSIEPVGQFNRPVTLRVSGVPDSVNVKVQNPSDLNGFSGIIVFHAPESAKRGEYPIQVVATADGIEHSSTFRLIVVPPLNPSDLAPSPRVKGRSVVLAASTSAGMAQLGCDSVQQIVRQLSETLLPGRDRLSLIQFAASVNTVLPMTANFRANLHLVLEQFSQVPCGGASNIVDAIERAREQLRARELADTDRVVVLLIATMPDTSALQRLASDGIRVVLVWMNPTEPAPQLPRSHRS